MTQTTESVITDLEHAWMTAWIERDMDTAARLIADDFTLTSSLSKGDLMSKAGWIAGATTTHAGKSFRFDRCDVRVYGDAAVVNVWYWQDAAVRGQDWSGNFLMTDVWIKRDDRWQVVARHASWLK